MSEGGQPQVMIMTRAQTGQMFYWMQINTN